MKLKNLQKNWYKIGKSDTLWAILSYPDKKGKWQIDEFFKTGVKEIDSLFKYIKSLGINISHKKALDFGCGVGRLTQALAYYFDEVYGVDIAQSMIDLAKRYNRQGVKCKYYLNNTNELKIFPDNEFNLIYSNITLQHIEPRYSKNYIREFLRILSSDGLLIFQLPSYPINNIVKLSLHKLIRLIFPTELINTYFKIRHNIPASIDMYGIKREKLVRFLKNNGARIIDIVRDQGAGRNWLSFRYSVIKE